MSSINQLMVMVGGQGGDNRRAGRIKALSVELAMEQEVVARAQQQVQERARRKAAATQRTQGTAALGRKDFAAAVSAFKAVSRSKTVLGSAPDVIV